jgi:tyrosine-protein phosphatase SIW14
MEVIKEMRDRSFKPLVVLIVAVSLCLSSVLAQSLEPRYPELPNFHQVNQGLYRGAQPRAEGMRRLAALGVKTVLNLRAADERSRAEEMEAREVGLRYFNIPMEGLDRPGDEEVARALALINDGANQPVFVHCKRGADRTGTVIAIYRITHDGWTGDAALREAKHYGLSWVEFGMKDYIKDYARDHSGQQRQMGPQPDRPTTTPEGARTPPTSAQKSKAP